MALVVRGIAKSYGGLRVLSSIDVDVAAGEIRALVGENGAGKSTFLKIVSGAVVPDAGTVALDEVRLPPGDPRAARDRGVNVVYQELTLVADLTVAENIFLGRELGRPFLRRADMTAAAQRVLDDLGIHVAAGATVRGLSVAHQQLVEIARALSTDARVLILDEPSATLSDADVQALFAVLRRLKARGLAIIYVSHRLDEIFSLADTVTVLRDGHHIRTSRVAAQTRDMLIRDMVGRSLDAEFPAASVAPGAPVLELRHLSAPPRFCDVSFAVRAGEIVGLAGLVGAGRTSTALALIGQLPSTGGMSFAGRAARFRSPQHAIAHGLAYVTEDRKQSGLFPAMGVGQNMTISHLAAFTRGGVIVRDREDTWVSSAATEFDIRAARLTQPIATLSGGNQQKALLARYLVRPPRLLILDEPTRGVDIGARAEIYRLMRRLTSQGLGILMISSDLPEVLGMSDRVVVMRDGRTTGELSRAAATAEAVMSLATTAVA